uniref:Dynactin subunit 3 n=1 Tax=Rhodotorula toruloides TaxID=5286 RepID=A0A0K3CGQ0_RHOTO
MARTELDGLPDHARPLTIPPRLALDLRLRFLESLVSPSSSSSPRPAPSTVPLARRVSQVEAQLKQALEQSGGGTEALKRFVQNYDANSPLLTIAPVPTALDSTEVLPQAKIALILEAEQEIRTLERELREIGVLDERGVVEAGKLGEHEKLKPLLAETLKAAAPVSASYASLELRTTGLLQRYNDYISTLSELFVSWNDIMSAMEDTVTKLEKEKHRQLDYA